MQRIVVFVQKCGFHEKKTSTLSKNHISCTLIRISHDIFSHIEMNIFSFEVHQNGLFHHIFME